MKITVQTLGCKVNQSESASIEGLLREHALEVVEASDNPDIFIINTCTVTSKSDYQSRQLIRRAIRSGAKVIATGCYAQTMPKELLEIKGLDLIIGNSEKTNILEHINKVSNGNIEPSVVTGPPKLPVSIQPYYSEKARAFLKIQDGCNSSCSYCAVPSARGRSRSLAPDDVLRAAEKLFNDGYREIVLTGIHIGYYGLDILPQSSLLRIVEMLITSLPKVRFRLSSIEPLEFREELLELFQSGSLCRHLHIPLQSGSDEVLKRMNRNYTSDVFTRIIEKISSEYPEVSIGTDVIAGFPGETDKDFHKTIEMLTEYPLSYAHVFPYSNRPNTGSFLMKEQVPERTKKKRVETLLEISRLKRAAFQEKNLGSSLDVIVEGETSTRGIYTGISDNYLKMKIRSDKLQKGQRVKVKVISLTDSGLISQHSPEE